MRRAWLSTIFLLLLAMGVCPGCGGGGESPTPPPPDDDVLINDLDGAADVAIDSAFEYDFAQAIDTSTVTNQTFFMIDAGEASADLSKGAFDPALCDNAQAIDAIVSCLTTTTCQLDPAENLGSYRRYFVCLSSDIRYLMGNPFEGFMATFTTAGTPPTYTVGGTVSGLVGSSLVLQDNGGDDLTVSADGAFQFATPLLNNAAYAVTVKTQPASPTQTCTVNSGSGTIPHANVTDVSVICSTNSYNVGGTVSGLDGTLVLQNNAGDDETIDADGPFTFNTALVDGADYEVTVKTPPVSQLCNVTNGTGTVAGANVTDVTVACITKEVIFSTTIASYTGNLGGIAGADAICNADPNKPDGRSYKALVVDGTNRVACTTANCSGGPGEHVDWVLLASMDYYRTDFTTKIGTTTADGIFAFPLDNGMVAASSLIWTGMNGDWTTSISHCSGWTSSEGAVLGRYAASGATTDHAISAAFVNCSISYANLICVSQ